MAHRIVVVEDEPLIRMDAVTMLETAGLDVVDFDRAEDALVYAREHCADVAAIFTDVKLRGDMDGVDLVRSVSRSDPHIALIVTSGGCEQRPRGLPDSAQFMKKPWLPLEVIVTLQAATGH